MVFFFLSLRESQNGGRIEPDILPTTTSSSSSLLTSLPKAPPRWQDSDFKSYITTWDFSDTPAILRKILCWLALFLHVPINLISIASYGLSLSLFLGIAISVLNLGCVGLALWKLDVMRGGRMFYTFVYSRKHFDYVILGLTLVYGFFFGMLLFVHMRYNNWVWFFRLVWPATFVADLICFISGWVATWRDVSLG